MATPVFGAGIWHFATYVDRYATDGYGDPRTLLDAIDLAGQVRDLQWWTSTTRSSAATSRTSRSGRPWSATSSSVIGITPEIYTREFAKGSFTNPDPGVRRLAHELVTEAAGRGPALRRRLRQAVAGAGRLGLPVPGRSRHAVEGTRSTAWAQLAAENPDLKFVIEYKPREPRVHMSFDSVARTLLGIEKIGLPNVGILLDFGHALFGGESPADSAQLAIDYGRLFGMDVNDNLRGWDDDMVAGHRAPHRAVRVLLHACARTAGRASGSSTSSRSARTACRPPTTPSTFLKRVDRGLERLDTDALEQAQARHDALAALRIAQDALYGAP